MGRITVDEAVYKVAMEGVKKAQDDINKLAMTYSNAMSGMGATSSKGTAGLVANNKAIGDQINKTSDTMAAMGSAANNMGDSLDRTSKKTRGWHEEIKKGESLMSKYIVRGMFMSIGWQAINNTMQFAMNTVKSYFMANVELEVSMKSLEFVARKTGRSFAEVGSVINRNLDSMTDKATLTTAVMKLMATSLSTEDIDKWIKSVKAGSAAMGADFNEQVILQAKGFKQLTANILDNVGVTIYLDQVKQRAAKTYSTTIALLTEEQIHQQLLTEQLKQTAKFTGLWEEKMKTTQGSMERLSTSWKRFMQEIGDTKALKNTSNALAEIIENLTTMTKYTKIKLDIGINVDDEEVKDQVSEISETINKALIAFSGGDKITAAYHALTLTLGFQKAAIAEVEAENLKKMQTDEQLTKTLARQTQIYKDSAMQLEINNKVEKDLTETTKNLDKSMSENNDRIQELTIGTVDWANGYEFAIGKLPKFESYLKDVNEALKEQQIALSEVDSQIKDYQSQLDRKLKIFDPESLKQTEDYLKDIQKELLSITREEERNQKDMWKRVEPKLRKQIEEDQVRIQKEKGTLLEEEKATRAKLLTEITDLTVKLEEQKKVKQDIKNVTIEIEGETRKLADAEQYVKEQIQDIKAEVETLNTKNLFSKEKYEEDMQRLENTRNAVAAIQNALNLMETTSIEILNNVGDIQSPGTEWTIGGDWDLSPKISSSGSSSSGSSTKDTSSSDKDYRFSSTKELLRNKKDSNAQAEMDSRGIKYELGTRFVPKTGMYQLHIGESVNTKRETDNKVNGNGMTFQPGSIVINAGQRSAESLFTEFERVARRKISRGARI